MRYLLAIVFLFSAIGCMNQNWGQLYDGTYSSAERVQAYADEYDLTYEEAFKQLHSQEQQMWDQINQMQKKEQPPVEVTEAKPMDSIL